MENSADRRIIFTERVDNAVIVTFDDGKCILYHAAFLYANLHQGDDITDVPNSDAK
jgi:hypothetical protein